MGEEKKRHMPEAEEVKEILGVVSTEIPSLIKGIIASVFSEEAGRNMGRAAASFYKELKESGIPEDVAVRMTENYVGVFTNLGDMIKSVAAGKKIKKKLEKKTAEEEED